MLPDKTQVFPLTRVRTANPCRIFDALPQALGSMANPVVAVMKVVAVPEKLAALVYPLDR
jgi:hypothetical protein